VIIGWRRNQQLFGKPDFIFSKLKLAIFVDGCFWHVARVVTAHPKATDHFGKIDLTATDKVTI
jgi:DNA mismatch endonuclease (patch repair protein)